MLLPTLTPGIHRQHQHLIAETLGNAADQRRIVNGRGVHAHLVRTAAQQRIYIFGRAHAPSDRERNENLFRGARDDVNHSLTMRARGGHIEERELIGPLTVILRCELHRIPGIPEVFEMNALDHTSVIDIQAGNHTYRQRHAHALRFILGLAYRALEYRFPVTSPCACYGAPIL